MKRLRTCAGIPLLALFLPSIGDYIPILQATLQMPYTNITDFGWEFNELTGKSKQIIKTLGYYATRREAEMALNEYLEEPYNISDKDITFSELYEKWSDSYWLLIPALLLRCFFAKVKVSGIICLYNVVLQSVVKHKDITFSELYEKWSDSYFPTLSGVSSERTITSASKNVLFSKSMSSSFKIDNSCGLQPE